MEGKATGRRQPALGAGVPCGRSASGGVLGSEMAMASSAGTATGRWFETKRGREGGQGTLEFLFWEK